jgi:ketosteroid isomerase-like protein
LASTPRSDRPNRCDHESNGLVHYVGVIATDVDVAAVRAANQAFYDAFERRDLDVMSEVWEHSDRIVCTHPGWRTLRGWAEVAASWFALFQDDGGMQFILLNEHVVVAGDCAWVTVEENLIAGAIGGTVCGLNLFVRDAPGWRMVAHHGSGVQGPTD